MMVCIVSITISIYKIKMPNIFLYQYMSITYASIIITCPAHAPVHAKFLWKQAHKNCVIQKIFIYCRKLKGKFFLAIEMYLENVLCNFRRFITFEKSTCFCPQCDFSIIIDSLIHILCWLCLSVSGFISHTPLRLYLFLYH